MTKAFESGGFVFNNEQTMEVCPKCKQDILPRSVHQPYFDTCKETIIHVHRWYEDSGKCYINGCTSILSKEDIIRYNAKGSWNLLKCKHL